MRGYRFSEMYCISITVISELEVNKNSFLYNFWGQLPYERSLIEIEDRVNDKLGQTSLKLIQKP